MPTLSFPSNPSLNDTYTFGGKTWIWNGSYWALQSTGAINGIPIGNATPSTGAFTTLSATGNITGAYVSGGGIAVTTVANTAPSSPEQGDIWINSDTGSQYIYFTSGGNSQWAEMEAEQNFSVTGSDLTAVSTDILPTANITYDIGNTTNRFRDIYLANSTIYLGEAEISATDGAIVLPANTTVGGAVVTPAPKVTGFTYPGDDTAADPAGGQTILINGVNFESGCVVYLDNAVVSPVVFISSTQLSFTAPAKATGTYSLYVINPDGSSALALPGIMYSGVPDWSTAAGSLGTPYETNSFTTILVATADSAVTYAASPGNTLPANLSLNSSTGNLTGTVPVTNNDTTYTFSVRATDAEQQDTDRQFSVTYKTDVVTWNSPANAASYTLPLGAANTIAMSATSAAGKTVSFAVQSGSLPSNVSISGNLITGTPNAVQSNTSVVIRATAATTNRFADRTLYFTVAASGWKPVNEYTYSSVTLNYGALGNWSGTALASYFKPDGTGFYVANATGGVRRYNLSTPWDLSTATYVSTFNIGLSTVFGLFFKPDGTQMYFSVYGNPGYIGRYNLGTPWDITTASSLTTVNISFQVQTGPSTFTNVAPNGFYITADGTTLISAMYSGGYVRQYSMSAWNLSTLSYTNKQIIMPLDETIADVKFKTDGSKMYLLGYPSAPGRIYQYSLATNFDISTATYDSIYYQPPFNDATLISFNYNADGTKMYAVSYNNTIMYEFNT